MSDTAERIKEKLSIVEVVSPYVELHKAGKNLKGKSPFTNEKTPSFYVSPDRGMYYCFSSSQGGDMFTFIEKMEGVDFKGALKILADKAGIELVPEDPKKRTERDQQYALLAEATRYFVSELAQHPEAREYLEKRGLTGETIDRWHIGFVPGPPLYGWRHTREHCRALGYSDDVLVRTGLIKRADTGKEPYDVFRDRIMFPIRDVSGRTVGFSGRILTPGSDAPKYVNSPETDLFNKSEILFGYDFAREGIRKFDFSLVVEGQFDVVLSHQTGYTNTVAVSGTALTVHHVELLGRLSNRVVLALDADRAGIAAVKRAADLMLPRGMDVKVARIIGGKDPADLIHEDPKLFKQVIGGATHVIEFLLAILKETVMSERQLLLRVRDEVLPYIARLESHMERDHFIGIVATGLNTTPQAVALDVARLTEQQQKPVRTAVSHESVVRRTQPSQRKDVLLGLIAVAARLAEGRERTVIEDAFIAITGSTADEARDTMDPVKVQEITFSLEQRLDSLSTKERQTLFAENLEELNKLVVREALIRENNELRIAEDMKDEPAQHALEARIQALQETLRDRSYRLETFQ